MEERKSGGKKWWLLLCLLPVLVGIYLLVPGFMKVPSVMLVDHAASADGSMMTLELGVGSSAGYIRKAAVHQQQGGKLYLDCYAAFGGINGSIGAKTKFTVPLDPATQSIAVYRNADCYEVILQKDADGIWQRAH